MAVYKVPQDVEADDKLVGPFTFRQFIYLIIVALSIALAWGLSTLFIPLAFVPLPIILLFGALALPLRKDQPMETYLAAMVSFFLKPHCRLWDPDGIDSLIEITVPKTTEVQRIKDISGGEAESRLSYLAEIVDSQGWAVRGHGVQAPNSAMMSDAYFEAQQVEDIMDNNNVTAQTFSIKLDQSDAKHHQDAVNLLHTTQPDPKTSTDITNLPKFEYNPYPIDMKQAVVEPIDEQPLKPTIGPAIPARKSATTTSEKPIAAGIINLANNSDLSIETIAREANRIHEKQDLEQEVVISLR
jgi:hypothetical protein